MKAEFENHNSFYHRSYAYSEMSEETRKNNCKHDIDTRPYKCDLCEYSTDWKATLDWHEKYVHFDEKEEATFKYEECKFTVKTNLNYHIQSDLFAGHDQKGNYKISWQDSVDEKIRNLKYDMTIDQNTIEKIPAFKCTQFELGNMCNFAAKQKQAFERHRKSVHKMSWKEKNMIGNEAKLRAFDEYKCPMCPFKATSHATHNEHLLQVHEIAVISNKSEEDKSRNNDLVILETEKDPLTDNVKNEVCSKTPAEIHTNNTLHCVKCSFSTENGRQHLKHHEKGVHGELIKNAAYKNYILQCKLCDFTTRNGKQHLREHDRREHEKIFFHCEICGKKAPRKSAITEHFRRVHMGIRLYKCSICKCEKYEKKQMVKHLKDCHKQMDDNYKIEGAIIKIAGEISKEAISKNDMTDLIVPDDKLILKIDPLSTDTHLHSGKEEYNVLNENLNSDDFKCNFCDYEAVNTSHLTRHKKVTHNQHIEVVHAGQKKKKKCDHCDYATIYRCALKEHVERKHREKDKDIECPMCNYITNVSFNLQRHLRNMHGKRVKDNI